MKAKVFKKGEGIMKLFTKRDKRSDEDKEIARVTEAMSLIDPKSEEYTKMAINRDMLKGKTYVKTTNFVSKDVLIIAGINLLLGVLTLHWEDTHVLTSKVGSLLIKQRV